ncbi:hypothetical protein HA402_013128 [Bradysia odoriphaga]|nr:hypothetical protein HA402_013128 [Bradysia odoriphaga]
MEQYFNNLQVTLTNDDGTMVPPENVYNFDETNLSDDPGVKKCIFKRGVKYPERICDSSKASTSLMFCGNATGKMLPPYVVYKAKHLYPTWMEGGPSDTRYNRSKSGWFDASIFADWFSSMFVPFIRKQKHIGKVVVIGDNLSSHFSEDVLSLCEANNIAFVCLPTNSTHMTQPLDVAFYGPLKKAWRGILDDWKKGLQKKSQTVTKESFPRLLNKLHQHVTNNDTSSKNLIAGFKKCGIYPLNSSEVIDRLPKFSEAENISENVSMAVMDMLQDLRKGVCNETKAKRRKIDVQPGKSVSLDDILLNQSPDVPASSNIGEVDSNGDNEDFDENTMDDADSEEENVRSTAKKSSKSKAPQKIKRKTNRVLKAKAKAPNAKLPNAKPPNAKSKPKKSSPSKLTTIDADVTSIASIDAKGISPATTASVHNVQAFDFVVVEFFVPQTKRFKHFIAKVVQANSDFHKVIFLQHHKSRFFWPDFLEERNILTSQVRRALTAPVQKGEDVVFDKVEILDFDFK